MAKIGILYGSSRPSNASKTVAEWFAGKVDMQGHEVEMIDLTGLNLPLVPEAKSPMMVENFAYETPEIIAWSEKVRSLDSFVMAVAEYNLGYSPLLKNSIDVLYHEWTNKPVALVSYGSYEKSTAKEQLRTVLSAPKMNVVQESFHITPSYKAITENGVDESAVSGDEPQAVADALLAKLTQ